MTVGIAEKRYRELQPTRDAVLQKARDCSLYTLPSLIKAPETKVKTPYQSVGAKGVNNLAAKLLLALFPPNMPFFRLRVDDLVLEQEQDDKFKTEIEEGLSKVEQLVLGDISSCTDRTVLFEGLKHCIVGGNVLFYCPARGHMRCFHLDRYVIKRDPMGSVLEIIIKETVSPTALPKKIANIVRNDLKGEAKDARAVDIFTYIKRDGEVFRIFQECRGIRIPKSSGVYPLDACPWIPVRFIRIDGEDYGGSYVEEYLGSFKSLEGLSRALLEGTAASSKVVFLINPNGTTQAEDLAVAPNCGFISGEGKDITVLQVEKQADLRVAFETIQMLRQELAAVFLLNTAIQRPGERVTAEEIRFMAQDLETALGGVYSLLAEELQLPYVSCKLIKLQKQGKMRKLPKGVVKPAIVTGVEALGRNNDKEKIKEFVGTSASLLGPEQIAQFINPMGLLSRLASALGVDKKGLVKDEEEIEQETQQAQIKDLIDKLSPKGMDIIKEQLKEGNVEIGS